MSEAIERRLNVGLIGYGYAGKTFHAPLIDSTSGLILKTVVSSNNSKVLSDFPKVLVAADAESMYSDPNIDLVVIATPNVTHFELAKRALEAGKNVVIDKPFVNSSHEALELVELAKKNGKMLSIFQNRRWDADFLTMKTVCQSGKLGEITYFQSNFDRYRPQVQSRWREQVGPGTGLWFDLGSHLIDQVVCLFGAPDTVCGDLEIQRTSGEAVDYFHVVLRYGKRRVIVHGSSLVAGGSARFIVHGTLGSYIKYGLDTQEQSLKDGQRPDVPNWGTDRDDGNLYTQEGSVSHAEPVPNERGSYQTYYAAVRDAILDGKPNPVNTDDALVVIRILELAVESAQSRQTLNYRNALGKRVSAVV